MAASGLKQFAGRAISAPPAPKDSDQHAEMLCAMADAVDELPKSVVRRLAAAARECVASGGKRTLDDCLGWKPARSSGRTIAHRVGRVRLEKAVVDAFRALSLGDDLSGWRRATVLKSEIVDFECNYWPTWSKSGLPSGRVSDVRAALYRAFTALPNTTPPKSERAIRALLMRAGELTSVDAVE